MPAIRMFRLAKVSALVCVLSCPQALPGQTLEQSKGQDQSDVLRVYTELVQTDVMVFDKQGRFVPGLKREDFELRIDGKPKPIEFFEKVTAGSVSEESQLAAARGSSTRPTTIASSDSISLDRGRPVFFYVDDFHLDLAGLKTTKELIAQFIEKEMGQNDEAAITSASGTIGFLQQLTSDKAVLRSALKRLSIRPYSIRDIESPPMTEYQATLVESYDRDLTDYFIEETLRRNPGLSRDMVESMVKGRARVLVQQASHVTTNTLAGLESLVRGAKDLPGRKLVFFISGGFFLGERGSDTIDKLRRITSAAARSAVVIYSMDARGLVATLKDASTDAAFDLSGRLQRADSGELGASQDPLNALAVDTGGKAVFNTNSLGPGLGRALKETSTYYVLAWKPERESLTTNKFRRLEVKVVGKPDLIVQVRRGFFDIEPEAPVAKVTETKKENTRDTPKKLPVSEVSKVILTPYPKRDIPVSLTLSYLNTPKGAMLTIFTQVPSEFLSFVPVNGKQTAVVDLAGTVLNDHGKSGATFDNRLTIEAPPGGATNQTQEPGHGFNLYVGPGLYQVRVGARDEKSGRSGSAHGWIEIPDLSSGELMLSSLLIGVRAPTSISNASSATNQDVQASTQLRFAHRFSKSDFLRFVLFVYNAARAPVDSKPDVALQVQVVRDDQPVVTAPQKKMSIEGIEDLRQIPYAAEVSLAALPAGRYLLQVTVVDRVSKRSASQQTRFEID